MVSGGALDRTVFKRRVIAAFFTAETLCVRITAFLFFTLWAGNFSRRVPWDTDVSLRPRVSFVEKTPMKTQRKLQQCSVVGLHNDKCFFGDALPFPKR